MATTLDSIVNFRNPLGLTSLTETPVKEKPTVAPSSQAAFPSIERPEDPRPGIERQRSEIGVKTEDLDAKIIKNLADQGKFQAQQAKQKAESEAQSLREIDTSKKALEKSLYESLAYKTIQEKSRELAEKSTFNPDQQNAQTLAAVFSIIGAAGFLLGGNNKNTAKSALAAMNGMAEGYAKGRDQYAKEQRQVFETNQKALRGTLDSLEKSFTLELEQNKNDLESATRNAKIAALQRDAGFINANIDKYGLVSTLEQLRSNKKRLETVLDALQKKEDAYKATLEKEWFSSEEKKAVAAAAQERVRYQEQERTARIAAGEKGLQIVIGPDGKPYQVRASNLPQLPSGQTGVTRIPSPQQPEKPTIVMTEGGAKGVYPSQLPLATGQEVRGGLGAKVETGEKVPADVEKNIKQNALIASNMDSTISSAQDLFKSGKLKSIGFVQGKIPYDIAQLYTSPEEKRFIAQMGSLTNQQLKLQSGATVTAAEFARQRGVLPLRDDTPETIVIKLQQWKDAIERETQVLGNAYPATVSKYLKPSLSQKMDERGAAAGQSSADERSQAQAAILKAQNNKDLTPDQKQKMIDQVKAVYKRETGLDL
jgi:hypothetical protein